MPVKPILKFPNMALPLTPYMADKVADHYSYPVLTAPTNQWVAIIELGGGYLPKDVADYCTRIGCQPPSIVNINVDGASNKPGDPADTEVALDMQCVIGATRGNVGLIMVWAPNTDGGFADAINAVVNDGRACAISISWGMNEKGWSAPARDAMNAAFQRALAVGIPSFAASGDDGSTDGAPGDNVDFPASSPYCVGVGGTKIVPGAIDQGWSYGGGGPSAIYPRPSWQSHTTNMMRGVPDVAADADPNTGYLTLVNGQWGSVGGTSASAPMLAAACAIITAKSGKKQGTQFLARTYSSWLMGDVTQGSNGKYVAGPDYDYVTGAGIPTAAWFADMIGAPVNPPPVDPPPPPPPPDNPCPTVCQSVRALLHIFNEARHSMEKPMTEPNFTTAQQQALTQFFAAAKNPQMPCGQILAGLLGACPTPPANPSAPAAGGCAALLQMIPTILQFIQTLQKFCPTQPTPTPTLPTGTHPEPR